jgi:hypothetical protein
VEEEDELAPLPIRPGNRRGGHGESGIRARSEESQTIAHSVTDSARGLDDRSPRVCPCHFGGGRTSEHGAEDGTGGRNSLMRSSDRLERRAGHRFGGAFSVDLVRARLAIRRKDSWSEPNPRRGLICEDPLKKAPPPDALGSKTGTSWLHRDEKFESPWEDRVKALGNKLLRNGLQRGSRP